MILMVVVVVVVTTMIITKVMAGESLYHNDDKHVLHNLVFIRNHFISNLLL